MFPNEVLIAPEDKKKIMANMGEICEILEKYPYFSAPGNTVTTMSRVKTLAKDLKQWAGYLHEETLTEENNMLVDYSRLVTAKLSASDGTCKGYRVYTKERRFAGVLDENKVALWYVDIDTVKNI